MCEWVIVTCAEWLIDIGQNFTSNFVCVFTEYLIMERPKMYHCSLCEAQFSRNFHLRRHIRTVHHINGQQFNCDICSKSFAREDTLKSHRMIHFPEKRKRHQCTSCNVTFVSKGKLTRHQESKHISLQFCCHVCEKEFSRKDALKRHLKIHAKSTQNRGDVKKGKK